MINVQGRLLQTNSIFPPKDASIKERKSRKDLLSSHISRNVFGSFLKHGQDSSDKRTETGTYHSI